jgi:flagellar basal body-associated protein FliL
MPEPQEMRPMLVTISLFIIAMLLAGAALGYAVYNFNAQQNSTASLVQQNQETSDHRWCATIELLTSKKIPKPKNPAANPSREATYLLYEDFIKLRREFRCLP